MRDLVLTLAQAVCWDFCDRRERMNIIGTFAISLSDLITPTKN